MFRHRLLRIVLKTTTAVPTTSNMTLSSTGARCVKTTTMLMTGICVVYCSQTTADCAADLPSSVPSKESVSANIPFSSGPSDPNNNDPVKKLLKQYLPSLKSLGFSGGMGICCAIALKRVSIQAAYLIGIGFTGLQVLSYFGYIQIDYEKVSQDAAKALDINRDGKLDENDLMAVYDRSKSVLTKNLQDVAGFTSGFFIGLYLA